jgi:hypothetical protein
MFYNGLLFAGDPTSFAPCRTGMSPPATWRLRFFSLPQSSGLLALLLAIGGNYSAKDGPLSPGSAVILCPFSSPDNAYPLDGRGKRETSPLYPSEGSGGCTQLRFHRETPTPRGAVSRRMNPSSAESLQVDPSKGQPGAESGKVVYYFSREFLAMRFAAHTFYWLARY